jgi:hypothetical protein
VLGTRGKNSLSKRNQEPGSALVGSPRTPGEDSDSAISSFIDRPFSIRIPITSTASPDSHSEKKKGSSFVSDYKKKSIDPDKGILQIHKHDHDSIK